MYTNNICNVALNILDPVRLAGGQTDSSESGRDSSLASREKRVKRGRQQPASSSEERCTSEESVILFTDTFHFVLEFIYTENKTIVSFFPPLGHLGLPVPLSSPQAE